MKKPRTKTPDPIVPDDTLETQMKAASEAPTEAIVKIGDARIESIKHPQGDRQIIRVSTGRFAKLATAVAAADAKQGQQFLAEKVKNEAGVELTRKQHMREALYTGAIKASQSDKGLGPAVKSFEALNEDAALTQAKETMLTSANQEVTNPVRVVILNCPILMHPDIIDGDKPKEAPKSPSFAEVTSIETNQR